MPKVTHATVTVNSNQISVMYYSVFMMVNLYSAREAALIPLKCFLNAIWECHRAQYGIPSSRSSCQQCTISHLCCSCLDTHSGLIGLQLVAYQPDFFLPLGVGGVGEIIKSNAFNWRSQVLSKHCSIRLCHKLVIVLSICSPGPWMSRQCLQDAAPLCGRGR